MEARTRRAAARRGFTLAEMMVVIVIIGLLATLVVPNVLQKYGEAAKAKARADIAQLVQSLNEYAIRNAGRFPDALDALARPDEEGHAYLQSRALPTDPWKHDYGYEAPRPGSGEPRPRVYSCGPDGQPGTGDDLDAFEGEPAR